MREDGLLGWATGTLVKMDETAPGVLSRVMTAAPRRRQAIFAALAVYKAREVEGDDLPAALCDVVRHGRVADILRHAFCDVPLGLPGLLELVGEKPLDQPEDYTALHHLARDDGRAVEALRGSGRITRQKLRVLTALDPRWRHANILSRIESVAEAITLNRAFEFLQGVCSRASDDAIAQVISAMRSTSTLPRLLDRLLRRADCMPPHPIAVADEELRPLLTVRDHMEVARKYRNCVAHRLAEIAAGRLALAEYRGEVLLEFRPLTTDAWFLWDYHGHRNGPVSSATRAAAASKCDGLNIARLDEDGGGANWRSYRRLTRRLEWDAHPLRLNQDAT